MRLRDHEFMERILDEAESIGDSHFEPVVKRGCICRNGGQPDEHGYIAYSPSCMVPGHGVSNRYVGAVPDLCVDVRKVG